MKLKNMVAGLLAAAITATSSPQISRLSITAAAEEQTYATLILDGKEVTPEIDQYGGSAFSIDGFEHTYKIDFPAEKKQEVYLAFQGEKNEGYLCDISWNVSAQFSGSIGFFDRETGNFTGGTRFQCNILDGNIGAMAGGGVLSYHLGVEEKDLDWTKEPTYIGPGSGTISFFDRGESTKTSIGFMCFNAGTIELTIRKATDEPTEEPDTPTEKPDTPTDTPEINYETGKDVKVTDYIPANGDTNTELHVISITKEQALNNPAYDVKATVTEKDGTKKSYTVRTEDCYKGFAYNTAEGKKTVTAENGYFIIVKIQGPPDDSSVSISITAVK